MCSLYNMAGLYQDRGDNAKAEPLYRQALEIRKQTLGEKHPYYAQSLISLALLYLSQGDFAKAEPLCRQALEIRTQLVHDCFAALGERQAFILQSHLQCPGYLPDRASVEVKADTLYAHVLAWKGAVMASQAEYRLAREPTEVKNLLARLNQTRSRWPAWPSPHQRPAARCLAQAGQRPAQREGKLGERSGPASKEYGLQHQHLTPADVAAALPAGTMLVDFIEYTHLSPPREGKGNCKRNAVYLPLC